MAAAIIPIIAAAAPLLTPLIEKAVMGIEHLFGAGQGQTKFDAVLASILPIAQSLATAGKIPGQLDPTSIAAIIQSVVSNLKTQGVLNPDIAAVIANQPIGSALPTSGTFTVSGGSLNLSFTK